MTMVALGLRLLVFVLIYFFYTEAIPAAAVLLLCSPITGREIHKYLYQQYAAVHLPRFAGFRRQPRTLS